MKISVLIPTYNRDFCILRALSSVFKQTYKPHEIIVVDDGSTDQTKNLINNLPIKAIFQSNKGVSSARNNGIKASSGDWIAFLDSDDTWHEKKLELQVKKLEETNLKFCHSDEAWIRNGKWINPKKHLIKSNENLFNRSLKRCVISPSSVVICKKTILSLALFDESLPIAEDYDLWLKFTALHDATYVNEKLVTRYAGHENQLSNRHSIDKYRAQSLKNLLNIKQLSKEQINLINKELKIKQTIYLNGLRKKPNSAQNCCCNRRRIKKLN